MQQQPGGLEYENNWVANSIRFGGRELDSETGLYYNRARYYDPQVGRFVSEDPIGLQGGMNPYAYAGNDPVTFSDPFGLCAQTDSIRTTVTVDCGDGTTSKKTIWVQQASDSQISGVVASAARLTGGNKQYTPDLVLQGYQTLAASNSIYVIPMTVNGHPVLQGGVTQTGGGLQAYTAFRVDALQAIASGDLAKQIGNLGMNAATVLGHEGAHLWGSKHPGTYAIKWGFKP